MGYRKHKANGKLRPNFWLEKKGEKNGFEGEIVKTVYYNGRIITEDSICRKDPNVKWCSFHDLCSMFEYKGGATSPSNPRVIETVKWTHPPILRPLGAGSIINEQTVEKQQVRVVSPYFRSVANEGEVLIINKPKKLETDVCGEQDFSHGCVVGGGGGGQVRRGSKGRVPPKSLPRKRITSPYFKQQNNCDNTAHSLESYPQVVPKRPKRRRKSKSVVLTAAQRRDEAYLRKTSASTWEPPLSPYHLLQEKHTHDPWRVLIICMLLNVTTGTQARGVIDDLFNLCPNAKRTTEVSAEEIEKIIKPLGLQRKRSLMIQRFSSEYMNEGWTHVTQFPGIGTQPICNILHRELESGDTK